MKFFKKLFTLLVLMTLIYSCSSDSNGDNGGDEDLAEKQNKLEDAPIALSNLNSGISIEGATKNAGIPPQPTSNLDFQLNSSSIEAYQSSGFNLKFSSSEANIAGAYILFKDLDDNVASEYFDVPVSSFLTSKSNAVKNSKSSRFMNSSKAKVDGDYEIDIDFGDSFPPGQFCGDLCIYDSQNNVGQIVTVCVEVEAWGGSASIVGEWIYESGTNDDDKEQIDCENGESIEVSYDEPIKEEFVLIIESDGDFAIDGDEEYKSLDWQATRNACEATYLDEVYKDNYRESGKWAYNEVNKTLTLVLFKYEDFLEPQYNEDYLNGVLLFEGDKVEIINGKLVITETFTEEGQTYTDVYTFRRK